MWIDGELFSCILTPGPSPETLLTEHTIPIATNTLVSIREEKRGLVNYSLALKALTGGACSHFSLFIGQSKSQATPGFKGAEKYNPASCTEELETFGDQS